MGTKCKIAYQKEKNVEVVNVNNDGAIEKMGDKLNRFYNSSKMVQMITNRGDMEVLGKNLKKYSPQNKNGTVDMYQSQKKKVSRKLYNDISDLLVEKTDAEFLYYFINEKWYCMKIEEVDGNRKPYLSQFIELESLLS